MFNQLTNRKEGLVDKRFIALHEIPEIDSFLDKGKEYFAKKYNIDYLAVHMIHHKRSCLVGFYDYDKWHEYLYQTNQGMNHPNFIKLTHVIQKEELYLEYFDSNMSDRDTNVRAEMFGVRKYGGCGVIISDELNNITVYDITFKDDSAFGTLDKKVLHALIKDLIRYKSLLLPFINHADQFNDFSDKAILHKSMDQFISQNSSLFYF